MRRALLSSCLFLLVACGGSDSSPTGPGTGTTPPSVTLDSPADGATLQGTVTLSASAENAQLVRFTVNGAVVAERSAAPFTFDWNTTTVVDGAHSVGVTAVAGSASASDAATVTVANGNGAANVVVTVSPATASVALGQSQQFSATVTGTINQAVAWTVDGGSTFGTVDANGLYTAPATLPTPASATVRATSAADPTRNATATVTLRANDPTAVPTGALQGGFSAGTDVALTADELAAGAVQVVFAISIANGGVLTTTGTATQSAQDPEVFSYTSAQPSDRLVVLLADGNTIEAVIAAFQGVFDNGPDGFLRSHSSLDVTVRIGGTLDLRIQSAAGPAQRSDGALARGTTTAFDRRITGTAVLASTGETMTVDVRHQGTRFVEVDINALENTNEETATGTITTPSATIEVASYYRYRLISVDRFVESITRQSLARVTTGGETWEFVGVEGQPAAIVRKAFVNAEVSDADFWIASGALLRNGQVAAVVRFNGPVVEGTLGGPREELAFQDGSVVPLATFGGDAIERGVSGFGRR